MVPSRGATATALFLLSTTACTGTDTASQPSPPNAAGSAGVPSVGGASSASSGSAGASELGTSGTAGAPNAAGAPSGGAGASSLGGSAGQGAAGAAGSSVVSGGGGLAGAGGSAGANNGPVTHRFLSGISDKGPVALVAADGHIEWQYNITGEANDAWLLANGNVVFAQKTGALELTPDRQTVWHYDAPSGSEVHSCQPLAGGGFLVGEAHDGGVGYLREVDSTGKVQKTVTINVAGLSAHGQFREVRKTPQGTYLVTYLDLGKAHEVDDTGKVLREFPCGSFVAVRLPNANTLISCGDDHRVIEVDPQGTIVWKVEQNEIPGNQLGFAAGVERLPNGNTVICNWPGHGGVPANQPQAFELTPDKKVVWQVNDPALGWVSNIEIIDPAIPLDGTALR